MDMKANNDMTIRKTKIIQGDLVHLYVEGNLIIAIVDLDNWFNKVKLLKASGLNYDWAKEQILKYYNLVVN